MKDAERFKLLGKYRTPKVRLGQRFLCEIRGEVTVCGLTDGPIPWPVGKRGRHKAIVVYKDLAKAIRRESEQAVARWWGVGLDTLWRWRRALGVGATTPGTSRLRSDYTPEPWAVEALARAVAKARGRRTLDRRRGRAGPHAAGAGGSRRHGPDRAGGAGPAPQAGRARRPQAAVSGCWPSWARRIRKSSCCATRCRRCWGLPEKARRAEAGVGEWREPSGTWSAPRFVVHPK
jgi:hypothetical protein